MKVQFSGIYRMQPVLSDKRAMVGPDDLQQVLQGVIDQVYVNQKPRAASFVVDSELVMVTDDEKGPDYTRYMDRLREGLAQVVPAVRRWMQPAASDDGSPKASMPTNRLLYLLPQGDDGAQSATVRNAVESVQREYLAKAQTVPVFVQIVHRRATEVGVNHPEVRGEAPESWTFSSRARSRSLLSFLS